MKLYVNQKVFTWGNRFTIKDEYGCDRYEARGEVFTIGHKLHVCDMSGSEVIYIEQKVFSFMPRYFVYINGQQIAEIVREFTFFKPKYYIKGLGWDVDGDYFAHRYTVTAGNFPVVTIKKEVLSWGDSYSLDIWDERNELPALAIVLAIDCVMAGSNSSSASH